MHLSHIALKITEKLFPKTFFMEPYPCKKDTEAAFLSHDKFPYKIHSRFRCSLSLCDRTQECLL